MLAREAPVTNDGPHYPLPYAGEGSVGLGKPLKPIVHPLRADIPIWLGAEGPKNVAQTAEIADGWIPIFYTPEVGGACTSRGSTRGSRGPAPGVPARDFEIAATCHLQITSSEEERQGGDRRAQADRSRCTWVAWAPRSRTSTRTSSTGWATTRSATRCRSCSSAGKRDEATALIPDELVEEMHIVGDAGYVKERVAAWEETGVTTLLAARRRGALIAETIGDPPDRIADDGRASRIAE